MKESSDYPMSIVKPEDTATEVCCVLTQCIVWYLDKLFGREKAEEVISETQMNLSYLENSNNWISFDYYCRLLEKLVEVTGDENAPFTANQIFNDKKALKQIGVFLSYMGSPRSFMWLVVRFVHLWNKVAVCKMIKLEKNHCIYSAAYPNHKQHRLNCQAIRGCLVGVPKLFGLPYAEVKELECICDGDDTCIFEMTWTSMAESRKAGIGLAIGLLIGIAIVLVGGFTVPHVAGGMSCALIGLLLGHNSGLRSHLRRAYDQNEDQASRLLESIQHVEEINKDLQRRIETRTQELSIANKQLMSALEELTQSQEIVVRSERQAAVGVLAAGMAHEINNPVNAIRLSVQTLLKQVDKSDPMYALLDNTATATSRCTRIVNDLLNFARKEQPDAKVDLKNVVSSSVEIFQNEDAGNIDVQLAIDEDVPTVKIDELQIQQAILNLMFNSSDAMKGSGKIDISLKRDGDDAVLYHSDTGPGISDEIKTKIFDPFFSSKDAGSSKGLGLSLTADLVLRNHGRIDLEEKEGCGACFVMRFSGNAKGKEEG